MVAELKRRDGAGAYSIRMGRLIQCAMARRDALSNAAQIMVSVAVQIREKADTEELKNSPAAQHAMRWISTDLAALETAAITHFDRTTLPR